MTAVPLLRGIYANATADFVASYPINREPVVLDTNLSKGFLRTSPGIALLGVGPGADRGGVNWNGVCYRVSGTKLISVAASGAVVVLGDVGPGGPVAMTYGFDRLAINSGALLWYWNGTALTQVTDVDLGPVLDVVWIGGYYLTTDGTSLIVTDLNDPTSVNPLKYGSSETDPDPITGVFKLGDEMVALNRYTTQYYSNIGGSGFPFQVIENAGFARGCVGPRAKAPYLDTFAFVGSGRNEALGVYRAASGSSVKISTKEIDDALNALSDAQKAAIEVETRVDNDEVRLIVHLPLRSYVLYQAASTLDTKPVWTVLASGVQFDQAYRGKHLVQCYGKWIVGDAAGNIGTLSTAISTHFGTVTGWQFDTALLYAGTKRIILKVVELVGITGAAPFGQSQTIFMSLSADGRTWGEERAISGGAAGDRSRNLQWRPRRRFQTYAGIRFRGADTGMDSYASLEVDVEVLDS